MSVIAPTAGEVFRVTIRKALQSNPSATWVNTYEIAANSAGLPEGTFANAEEVRLAALTIYEWERNLHLVDVLFTRVTVSTWVDDSTPYNGDEFSALPVTASGLRVAPAPPLGLESCLFIERQPLAGRTGKIYLRRCLREDDVSAPAGKTNLESTYRTALNDNFAANEGNLNLIQLLSVEANALMVMASRNSSGDAVVRRVFGISASDRVVNKKTDNRWFNRSV